MIPRHIQPPKLINLVAIHKPVDGGKPVEKTVTMRWRDLGKLGGTGLSAYNLYTLIKTGKCEFSNDTGTYEYRTEVINEPKSTTNI